MQAKVVEITENYVNLLKTLSNLMGISIINYKSFDFYSNPASNWFTRIVLKGNLQSEDLLLEIEDLRLKGFDPYILDFLNTRAHEVFICELGYNSCDEQIGMFLEGDAISFNKKLNTNLNIQKIESEKDLKIWLKILNDSFESEDRLSLYSKLLNIESFRLYGGFVNGQMTTTGMTFYDGESFGLYSITTDRNYRDLGYASNIVEHILGEIREVFFWFYYFTCDTSRKKNLREVWF